MIRAFPDKDQRDWDIHLHEFRFAYNSTVNNKTKPSLAFLNFSRELRQKISFLVEEEGLLEIPEPNRE